MNNTPSFTPICPNHFAPLEGCGFPLPSKGTGVCPVSGASFDFEVEVDEEKEVVDVHGNISKKVNWKVQGNE